MNVYFYLKTIEYNKDLPVMKKKKLLLFIIEKASFINPNANSK